MRVLPIHTAVQETPAAALVVGVYEGEELSAPARAVSETAGDLLPPLLAAGEISGKLGEVTTFYALPGVAARLVAAVGLGPRSAVDRGTAFRAAAAAARHLAVRSREAVAFFLEEGWPDDLLESAVAGAVVGCQGQDLYRAEKKRHPFAQLLWGGGPDAAALQRGLTIGQSVNLARRLVDEPPQVIFPASLAQRAEAAAAEAGLAVEVWDEQRLAAERCGALLAVAAGSAQPPRLVILRHRGSSAERPQLALVGKGVTFDSGGLSLKPHDALASMKCDMAGAAAVLAAMQAIARLGLPLHVVGLMGLVENLPSGTAVKVGDVLTARNGKTIEVHNTDAEGRLVLADVLDVARGCRPERIVDLATLTGACVVALGNDVAGMMTNDPSWCDEVRRAADACGERVWQLPMFPEYGELIRGEVADLKNVGEGRAGGAITAAKFLEQFVGETPWVHLDIAGPAFQEKPKPWLDGGGTGAMVRTLVELARRLAAA